MNKTLRNKLLTMAARDQKMRKSGTWDVQIDRINTKALKKILSKYEWPHDGLVGKKGSEAAWLIAQHADHDVHFQEYCLECMTSPTIVHHVSPIHIAYLTDRVRVNQKKKQIYGTQFYSSRNQRFLPRPIMDKRNLNRRRKRIGLEPFERYKTKLHSIYTKQHF